MFRYYFVVDGKIYPSYREYNSINDTVDDLNQTEIFQFIYFNEFTADAERVDVGALAKSFTLDYVDNNRYAIASSGNEVCVITDNKDDAVKYFGFEY